MDMVQTIFQFSVVKNMRTGNPILDVMISGMILSLITYVITNFSVNWSSFTAWLRNLMKGTVKCELSFQGEEYINRWGDTIRQYPSTFRAILHYIEKKKPEEVTMFEQLRTSRDRWNDDDDKKGKDIIYKPNVETCFKLDGDILCEISSVSKDSEDKKSSRLSSKTTTVRLFSHTLEVHDVKSFMNNTLKDYRIHMKEEVDKNQYYFITKVEKVDDVPELMYDEYTFSTNRSFSNIFFPQKERMVKRLDFFLNNREWYKKRGVPYTLGFMLYGPPGTGKTSTIKAIAAYTKRHLIEVSLGRIKTYKQLQKVFHDTTFCEKYIPHHKIIYILEDIDCLDDIVRTREEKGKGRGKKGTGFDSDIDELEKKRKGKKDENDDDDEKDDDDDNDNDENDKENKGKNEWMTSPEYLFFKEHQKIFQKDPLTLSHILNILDGILETPGRILIITTNHPENLDSALIRPGRIDMKVHFRRCTRQDTVDIVEMFFEKKFPPFEKQSLVSDQFTPAEVYQICFQSESIDEAIAKLNSNVNLLSMSAPIPREH